jgi:pantoate--beta-alanine ligase
MQIIRTVSELRAAVSAYRKQGKLIAFVPTMGALHAGHLALIEFARKHADVVVSSIFVNPKQFGPNEDYQTYPRQEEVDCEKLASKNVEIAYLPDAKSMFPQGFSTKISVEGIKEGLCGASRPGFFDGVALVVSKLLIQVMPDVAVFGEKDYQQLLVVTQMAKDLDLPIEIKGAPIVREQDGLAMSSRNVYLNAEERQIAPAIFQTLLSVAEKLQHSPEAVESALTWGKEQLTSKGFRVDYMELRDAVTLKPLDRLHSPARLLVAAFLGKCRLIDNIAVNPR